MVEWCLNQAMKQRLYGPQVHVQSVTGSITSLIILRRANSAHTVKHRCMCNQ